MLSEKASTDSKALEEELAQKRMQSEDTARLLQQQKEEVGALRGQLDAVGGQLKAEIERRETAERRADQLQLQLSMLQSEHLNFFISN